MSMDWLNDNSGGGSDNPGVYFGEVGAKVVGKIVGTPRQVNTQFGEKLVVDLVAADGCTARKGKFGDGGKIAAGDEVTLWVSRGAMATAIRDAIVEVEAPGLSDGGTIAVAFTDTVDTGKPQPAKLYTAQYVAPVAAVAVGDSLI